MHLVSISSLITRISQIRSGVDPTVATALLNSSSSTMRSLVWMLDDSTCSGRQSIFELTSSSVPMLSEPSRWKQLRTLAVGLALNTRSDFENLIKFLTMFHPPCLEDVAVHARTSDKDIIYAAHRSDPSKMDADLCLKLQDALLKFRRPQLSFQVSLKGGARKHLWNRELGQRFPTLRDLDRLTVNCESSET